MLYSSITNVDVHDTYVSKLNALLEALVEQLPNTNGPNGQLSYPLCIGSWQADFPFIRIATNGSDLCDFCIGVKSKIRHMGRGDERQHVLLRCWRNVVSMPLQSFQSIALCSQNALRVRPPESDILFFDFADNVLLPSLLKQAGQLYFITGLKFDIFGVSSSNEGLNYIFGLP